MKLQKRGSLKIAVLQKPIREVFFSTVRSLIKFVGVKKKNEKVGTDSSKHNTTCKANRDLNIESLF